MNKKLDFRTLQSVFVVGYDSLITIAIFFDTWKFNYKSFAKMVHFLHLFFKDEYGRAAYKAVELDNIFRGSATQHRQVEGHESHRFKQYFHNIT